LRAPVVSKGRYTERTFDGADLAGSEMAGAGFQACRFVRCCFNESVLRACAFEECVFVECDLSLVKLPHSVFSSTRFEDSKIIGVNWTEARWPRLRLLVPVRFERCVISHSTFLGLNLKDVRFIECTAKDVDFREADLSKADFSGTDLTGAQFGSTDLTGANLESARNYRIVPAENTLKGARFSLPEAMSLLSGLDIEISGWD